MTFKEFESSEGWEEKQINVIFVSFLFKEIEKMLSKSIGSVEDFMVVSLRARTLLMMTKKDTGWLEKKISECIDEYARLKAQSDRMAHIAMCGLEIVKNTLDEIAPYLHAVSSKIKAYYEEED